MILFTAVSYGQDTVPKLEVEEEYQILGKDTRVFTITGERSSTVGHIAVPLRLVSEERTIGSSEGLISEDERIRRKEAFNASNGLNAWGHYSFGAHNTSTFFGKADYDAGTVAGSVALINRSSEENTPLNTAALSQDVEVAGFIDTPGADYALSIGFSRDEDDSLASTFRPGNHEVSRTRSTFTVKPSIFEEWSPVGRMSVASGNYVNYEDPADAGTLIDENELIIDGGVEVTGELYNFTATGNSNIEYFKLGGDSGTLFTTEAAADWLFMNAFGLSAGAEIAVFELPGDTTKTKIYPKVKLDWALTPGIFFKAQYDPGMVSHSFGGMFDSNGLITLATPMVFEERTSDISGEFGFRTRGGLSASVGGFAVKSEDSPVFSRTGDYFEIVKNADVELTGFRVKTEYTEDDLWGLNGQLNVNNADWNFAGEVPYVPNMDARIDSYYIPHRLWKIRASLTYTGKHYVELNKDDSESSFVMIDLGADRELLKEYISMYVDLRNITDSNGSWWTGRYNVPGIGIYIGIKAQY